MTQFTYEKNTQTPYSFALPIVPIIGASGLPSHLDRGNFMEQEIWKDIIGHEGLYQISNLARIKSLSRIIVNKNGFNKIIKERILSPVTMNIGYVAISLWRGNKDTKYTLHRLMAIHFIPNSENKKEVNHINGNRGDNNLLNLEWVTPSENMKHAMRTGKCKNFFQKGFNHKQSKLSREKVLAIREMRKNGARLKEIGRIFDLTMDHVCRITKKRIYAEI